MNPCIQGDHVPGRRKTADTLPKSVVILAGSGSDLLHCQSDGGLKLVESPAPLRSGAKSRTAAHPVTPPPPGDLWDSHTSYKVNAHLTGAA
ncbi:hypothetical protein AAFF_G00173610 [Aldrovandia affinis]|uniref:Uncharacterized protein n=1 Tax=Aldrovandia affinis TaxID=143900 RepID=A0AAD7SZ69_9TELE|nr:hypothetical protein AAFF_G00173610 [Aldrovandia affinis]